MIRIKFFRHLSLGLICTLPLILVGCGSSLPKGEAKTQSQWQTFEEAKAAYDSITLHETTTLDLQQLGFDPYSAPNVRILSYLDIIHAVRPHVDVPLAAYHVSGEYSMIKAAAANGWIDHDTVALEQLTAVKRAGADLILTYFTRWFAERARSAS